MAGLMSGCLLCGSRDVAVVDRVAFSDLRQLWFETFEVDIATCLDVPYDEADVPLRRCAACRIEFYPPALRGNETLYDKLQAFEFYYPKEKWEFEVALRDLALCRDIVEIGCGPGRFLERAVSTYPETRVRGLELNADCVRTCRERGLEVEGRTIEDFAATAGESLDAVCGFQVLEHVAAPATFLGSAFRCLRPGGLALISVPNAQGFTRYAVNAITDMPPHHVTRWTVDVMRRVAVLHGMILDRVVEEPVAEYHKEAYRTVLTLRAVSALLRRRWRRVDRMLPYRLMLAASDRLQRAIPASLWRYTGYPGHTLYVTFRKPT